MPGSAPFREGEVIALTRRGGHGILLELRGAPQTLEGVGVIDLSRLVGASPGTAFDWAGTSYLAVRPDLHDRLRALQRRAQIITPKDAVHLLYLAGVGPGSVVFEAGAGSGAMTTVLAHAVGPDGRVVSYDRREDFLEIARRNVARAGLARRVEFRVRDVVADGFDERGADGVVLDLPEPWGALEAARSGLVVGGRVGTFTPTYNQLEHTVRDLRRLGFDEVESVELLERSLHVGEGGTRPEFEMLGHTGFLTGARRGG